MAARAAEGWMVNVVRAPRLHVDPRCRPFRLLQVFPVIAAAPTATKAIAI